MAPVSDQLGDRADHELLKTIQAEAHGSAARDRHFHGNPDEPTCNHKPVCE